MEWPGNKATSRSFQSQTQDHANVPASHTHEHSLHTQSCYPVTHCTEHAVQAIFEFGRGFYGNTYSPVLSDLTLTPGRLHIFVTASDGKLGGALERG